MKRSIWQVLWIFVLSVVVNLPGLGFLIYIVSGMGIVAIVLYVTALIDAWRADQATKRRIYGDRP